MDFFLCVVVFGEYETNQRGDVMAEELDEHAATELSLYIDNDGDLYRQMTVPILKNLANKKAQGKYNHALAIKAFMYLADAGAKKYAKEFDSAGNWYRIFNVPTRKEVAKDAAHAFEAEWKAGSYRNYLTQVSRRHLQ